MTMVADSYTSKDLLPCPFCGSTEAPAAEIDDGSTYLQIVCSGGDVGPGCGASSGYAPTLREAIGRWNARSNGPKQPALDALMGVLDELEDYLEQRQDIKDGGDGTPRPNEEMSLLSDLQWWRSAAGLSSATSLPPQEKP